VIDYKRENFTLSGHHSILEYRRALKQDGRLVWVGGALARMFQAISLKPLLSLIDKKNMRFFIAKVNVMDLLFLRDLLEAGRIVQVIDRQYPPAEVAEALCYREEGHALGKIVITIPHDDEVEVSI
jgi:NADPH:quinone reductase-like Zn-dependent oxidoreductase